MCGDTALNFLATRNFSSPQYPSYQDGQHRKYQLWKFCHQSWSFRGPGAYWGMHLFGAVRYQLIAMVVVVLALDTAHKFLLCAGIWNPLIQYYGDIHNLFVIQSPALFAPSVTPSSVVARFCHRYNPTSHIGSGFGSLITYIFCNCAVKTWKVSAVENLVNASNGITAAVDIVIAIAMCTLLAMGRSGFSEKTDQLVLRLIVISLNTGLWTAILALLSIILLVSLPSTEVVYTGVYYPLGSLYCNTLLANLNVRPYLRGGEQVYSFRIARSRRTARQPRNLIYGFRSQLDITAETPKQPSWQASR
ncbi:hypothetical protein BU15DRAFT_62728 [Melanogaster broomeanus]|nr:hypothetical protein BU15DRAFT_62728 [Melanogaster broomeanus]